MENKRFKMFIGIVIIVALVIIAGFYIFQKLNNTSYFEEYTPEQEISDEQFRSTNVKLFFKEADSNNLKVESRNIDAKDLISNPYLTLVNLLIQGPTGAGLQATIPEGTTVNNANLSGDMLVLDLSESFINNHPGSAEAESATIYSIVNTLTELTEVNSVKFLINGQENCAFSDNMINFSNPFVRK